MKRKIKNIVICSFIFLFLGMLTGCSNPEIKVANTSIELILGESLPLSELGVELIDLEEVKETYTGFDEEIIQIKEGIIYAEKVGETKIVISVDEEEVAKVVVDVKIVDLENFAISGDTNLIIGESAEYMVTPNDLNIEIKSNDEEKLIFQGNKAFALAEGVVELIAEYKGSIRTFEVVIEKDNVSPVINSTVESEFTMSWNENIDIFEGITATDNIDKEIELTLENEFDREKMGEQTITYVATDSSGNKTTLTRKVNIIWDYSVEFIGHAGSYYGLMNSEEAILYAIQELKYQCVEIDLKQTADGQFVLCHDDVFEGYTLSLTTWDILKNVTRTARRSDGYPSQNGSVKKKSYTAGLCTLERYLEICKEYNVKAVIELKSSKGISNNDTSRMQALMDIIEKYKMRKNVIFLTSSYNCLIWTRNNGYSDIPCQYLVNSCESEEILNRCIQYNLDISVNATGTNIRNSNEWLNKYKAAGLKISCYTFTQYSDYKTLQKWIDKGVDYVTCDWHLMSKVNLPKEEK